MEDLPGTVVVKIAPREDGGIRVWSDQMPGLILSGSDPAKVGADIWPAIRALRDFTRVCDQTGMSEKLREE